MSKRLALESLELKILEALWERAAASTARQLQPALTELTHATLVATLNQLYRKQLLRRSRLDSGFSYEPCYSRNELHRRIVFEMITDLLAKPAETTAPSTPLSGVRHPSAECLDEFEALVRAERLWLRLEDI